MLKAGCRALFSFTLALGIGSPAVAWEVEAPVSLPSPVGIVPAGVFVSEVVVDIKDSMVTTAYVFSSRENVPKQNIFSIYLAPFSWSGVAAEYPDRHFPELRVVSDGQSIPLRSTVTALHDGRDITDDLIRTGLDPAMVSFGADAFLDADEKNDRHFKTLIEIGALKRADGTYLPTWYVQYAYSWPQTYKPGAKTRVELRYRARPGFSPIARNDRRLMEHLSGHCGSPKDLDELVSGDRFSKSEDFLIKTYVIHFGLGQMNLDKAKLSYSEALTPETSQPAMSYVCIAPEDGMGERGKPLLNGVDVRSQDGSLSLLVISGR